MISKGIWPTMITPFTPENKLDEDAVRQLIDWFAMRGCDGVFAVCQSSEMFHLSLEERVQLAKTCVEAAGDRLQVIASGHISDDPEEQIREIRAIWETGVRAVVLVSNRIARKEEDDDVWIANAQHLLDALPDVTLGMYECPSPYKRVITEKILRWMVRSGRFHFLKDTCCDADVIRRRLQIIAEETPAVTPRMGWYNANTMTLLQSLQMGADGFCGIMGNYHPELYQWLFRHYQEEPERAEAMQSMLSALSALMAQVYPLGAKVHMMHQGISMTGISRCMEERTLSKKHLEQLRQGEVLENLLRCVFPIS